MAYNPEQPFTELTDQQKIHHIFDAAYDATDYSQADDYAEGDFMDLQTRGRDSLEEFALQMLKMRHGLLAADTNRPHGMHAVNPNAYVAGNFHHVTHPLITFTIDSLRGMDSKGNSLIADRLLVFANDVTTTPEVAFARTNYASPELRPLQYRYPAQLLTQLCVNLETIVQA